MPPAKIRRKGDAALNFSDDQDPAKDSTQPRSGGRRDKFTLRAQQKIACAECRRLKVKCDRSIPCTTCIKRGCASLCPNGTLPPGDGSRFVMVASDHLHTKLGKLEARMRSLEDALAIASAATGKGAHPLLSSPFQDEKADEDSSSGSDSEPHYEEVSLAKALNTLSIENETQEYKLSNSSGMSGNLVDDAAQYAALSGPVNPSPDLDPAYLGPEINLCQRTFPFHVHGVVQPNVQALIESYLPPIERAVSLCEKFFKHLSWMASIVQRDLIIGNLIPRVYKHIREPYTMHELGLVFVSLAIGAEVSLEEELHSFEAQHYCLLGKAALAIPSVLHSPTLITVKAVHLLSIACGLSAKEENMAQSTTLLALTVQMGFNIGLHIDPSRFHYNELEIYERRDYFWNLTLAALWTGLTNGRSVGTYIPKQVDCKVPTPEEEQRFRSEDYGFGAWGCRIASEYILDVHDAILGVKLADYSRIIELDKQIREEAVPLARPGENIEATMKQYAMSNYLDLLLLYLHRPYFAQAMSDHPTSPKDSCYYQSVLAAYRAACIILETTNTQFVKEPELCSRVWRMWSYAFTAAIVVGTLAMRGITLDLDPNPKHAFEKACIMFKGAADQGGRGGRAARALPLLEFMRRKAREIHSELPPKIKSEPMATDPSFDLHSQIISQQPTSSQSTLTPPRQLHISPPTSYSASAYSPFPSASMDEISVPVDPFTPNFGNLSWQGMFDVNYQNVGSSSSGLGNDFWMPDLGGSGTIIPPPPPPINQHQQQQPLGGSTTFAWNAF